MLRRAAPAPLRRLHPATVDASASIGLPAARPVAQVIERRCAHPLPHGAHIITRAQHPETIGHMVQLCGLVLAVHQQRSQSLLTTANKSCPAPELSGRKGLRARVSAAMITRVGAQTQPLAPQNDINRPIMEGERHRPCRARRRCRGGKNTVASRTSAKPFDGGRRGSPATRCQPPGVSRSRCCARRRLSNTGRSALPASDKCRRRQRHRCSPSPGAEFLLARGHRQARWRWD